MIYKTYSIGGVLYHHGIEGQQWGVMHGPPYPLDKTMSNKIKHEGQKTKYIKERDLYNKITMGEKKVTKAIKNVGTNALLSDLDNEWEEMMTTNEPIFGQLLDNILSNETETEIEYQNARDGSKLAPAGAILRELIERNKEEDSTDDRYDEDSKWSRNVSKMQTKVHFGEVNPGFGSNGTVNNCTKCTFYTELLSRGINESYFCAGRQTFPASANWASYWFKGAHEDNIDANDLDDTIGSYGNNSSGAFRLQSKDGASGHAIHWTAQKNNKEYSVEDGQSGEVFMSHNSVKEALDQYMHKHDNFGYDSLKMSRLDNCEIDWDNVIEDGVVRHNTGKVWNHKTKRIVDTW